jgi:hypothetical protein
MKRLVTLSFLVLFAAILPAQEEQLPKDPSEPLDIEPPLLIQEAPNRNIVNTTPSLEQKSQTDPDQIAASLEKARRSAAAGERFFKAGIIAKVDSERRALKVVRLEADLAEAKLELAKQNVAAQEARAEAGEIPPTEVESARSLVVSAMKESEAAAAKKEKAELDAAMLNLQRQQKLLAMGSGRKSEVNRAREKVSALQQKN